MSLTVVIGLNSRTIVVIARRVWVCPVDLIRVLNGRSCLDLVFQDLFCFTQMSCETALVSILKR